MSGKWQQKNLLMCPKLLDHCTSARAQLDALCKRAKNYATKSRLNLPRYKNYHTLFAHSSTRLLSPILATAE